MKKIAVFAVVMATVTVLAMGLPEHQKVKAAENNELGEVIEKTIDSDREVLRKLSSFLEKAYQKIISVFKKCGTLGKDISRVVRMYNALDEQSEDYPERLEEFFTEYNKLSNVKKKAVDFLTHVLDAKEKLLESVSHIVTVDMFSVRELKTRLVGDVEYYSENETIAEVSCSGEVVPNSIGTCRIVAQNSEGEKEVFRLFVKKPVLSKNIRVGRGNTCIVDLPSETTVNEIAVSNERQVECVHSGNNRLEFKGISKGTAVVYVGQSNGKTVKFFVRVT